MSEIIFIAADEAEKRVSLMAERMLKFMAEFNSIYPDSDAEAVASHFSYFTKSYVFQTCASILSEKLIITPRRNMSLMTIEAKVRRSQQFSKGELTIFPQGSDKLEAG